MITQLEDVRAQVKAFWSSVFVPQLLENARLAALVNRAYQGQILAEGDRVKVSQIIRPTAQRRQVGVDDTSVFTTQKLQTQQVEVVADQVISAGYEIENLVTLQSQIQSQDSTIRQGLVEAMIISLNEYLYGLAAAPTTSNTGVTDFNASQLIALNVQAGQKKWPEMDPWYLLADPVYHGNLLSSQTLTDSDFVDDRPVVAGKMLQKKFNFNILQDNSAAMSQLSPTGQTSQLALAFHPDFLYLVLQQEPEFEISSLHANKQFGYVLSAKMIAGAKVGLEGAAKHIRIYNT